MISNPATDTPAYTRGRTDYAEGVPGNLSPYPLDPDARAWMKGWWSAFRDYPSNQTMKEEEP